MMENTIRRIKVRTVLTKFKNSSLTLEEIGKQEYQMDDVKFIEYLSKHLNNTEFKKLMKSNDKRKSNEEMEEVNMKARVVKRLDVDKNEPKDQSYARVVKVGLADPRSTMENLLLEPKPKAEPIDASVTKEAVAEPEIMDIKNHKKGEENMKQGETKRNTLEKLKDKKRVIENQIKGQEVEREFKLVILQSTEQKRDEKLLKVEELKKQLATAEEELLVTECEVEQLNLEISATDEQDKKYRQELAEVEEQIQQESIVYLMAPSYRGHPKKEGHYVASAPGKGEGVEVDPYGENLVDEMTRKEIKSKAAEYGYEDYEKFASDYAFALIVKKYHEEGANYSVKTSENALINELLNKIVGKDV